MKYSKAEIAESIEALKALLNPNGLEKPNRHDYSNSWRIREQTPRVFFVIRKVSASGMSRTMSAYVIKDNDLVCLDRHFRVLMGIAPGRHAGFRIGGCGMDMRFAALDNIARHVGLSANDFRIEGI